MRILAIETIAKTGTLALAEDERVLHEKRLNPDQRSAQSLAPALAELLAEAVWRPSDIALVAVAVGPGSFTGLRVGVATAKVFAYSVGAHVVGVNALEAIAAAAPDRFEQVEAIIDAQRGDVVAQAFQRDPGGILRSRAASRVVSQTAWIESLEHGAVVSGPGLEKLASRLPEHVCVVPAEYWHPRAAHVALIGFRDFAGGRRDDVWSLLPVYSRRAAAEEQWEKLGK